MNAATVVFSNFTSTWMFVFARLIVEEGDASARDCNFLGVMAEVFGFAFRMAWNCSVEIWMTGIDALPNLDRVEVLRSFAPLSCAGGVTMMSALAPCLAASLAFVSMPAWFVHEALCQRLLPSFCGSYLKAIATLPLRVFCLPWKESYFFAGLLMQ